MKFETEIKCRQAQELMSPYIDSMTDAEDCARLEMHLSWCEPCQRQLQIYKSLRSMMTRIEPVRPSDDLALDCRVRLSHVRAGSWADQVESVFDNVLRPVVMPAVSGIALTALSFMVLIGNLSMNLRAAALDSEVAVLEQPVDTTIESLAPVSAVSMTDSGEPLSVQANVGRSGKVLGYKIIGGVQSPAVTRWINNLLFPAQFKPAMRNNEPVPSTIILSFMNVRS